MEVNGVDVDTAALGNVLVVGNGYVGKAYGDLLQRRYYVHRHDPPQARRVPKEYQEACVLAIIAVPTPQAADGSCDTSIVAQALNDLPAEIPLVLIKSTVPPGTTQSLQRFSRDQQLVFSPEYIGEGGYHVPAQFPDPRDPLGHGFMILGGESFACSRIIDLFLPIVGPSCRFRMMSSKEAELVKYFENSWLAMKVTFANEQRRICEAAGANYHAVREGWLDDSRVGLSHSAAFAQRPGFDGKCLPKDTAALLAWCRNRDINVPLLTAMVGANQVKY